MKRILNGKRYDTATATEIASWKNGLSSNDFHYCEETLYRTKNGAFFLVGEGGALSAYSRSCGSNSSCGGSELLPLSEKEVREWLEDHDCTDELEELFGSGIIDA